MSRVYIRCSREKCKLRYTLKEEPGPRWKCKKCGGKKWRLDKTAMSVDPKQFACYCGGYAKSWEGRSGFHKIGGARCEFRADGTKREPGDADYSYESDEEREWYAQAQGLNGAAVRETGSD